MMAGAEAKTHFFLFDKEALITKDRGCIDSAVPPFAKDIGQLQSLGLHEGSDLLEVDLPPTFPGHPALADNGRNSLRRLLIAYARHVLLHDNF
ncbi:unnamed protein product [Lactuca virosa]|uniref:Uncharacterized protein n=1 Tax=Lactuca virosa TaxID=75947 RepID=A0AAU9N2E3_9ASTR|nr:unnamed protein product [Lactuca virosa]